MGTTLQKGVNFRELPAAKYKQKTNKLWAITIVLRSEIVVQRKATARSISLIWHTSAALLVTNQAACFGLK
jgi:hypothetical protein